MRIPLTLGAAAAVIAGTLSGGVASAAPGDTIFALTDDNTIVSFAPATPGNVSAPMTITGLNAGETLVGIDFRPANNMLYGLGSTSQLYTINTSTGAATKVGTPFMPTLDGMQVGFDFNPAVDRIRVVTDAGQNLRLHPDTGAVVATDGGLKYKAGDTNEMANRAIAAAAYTNPDNDPATGTVLFDIDSASSTLVRQDPPNDGVLSSVGSLGVTTAQQVAFDIGPTGAFIANRPTAADGSHLYRVDITTGAVTDVGAIGSDVVVTGMAIRLEAVPAPPTTPAPSATPTRPTAPMPPNTGDAGLASGTESGSPTTWILLGGALLAISGGTLVASRRPAEARERR